MPHPTPRLTRRLDRPRRWARLLHRRLRDLCRPSYHTGRHTLAPSRLFTDCRVPASCPRNVLMLFLEHRFDLLGSGWVRVHPGMSCRGLQGRRYAPRSAGNGRGGRPGPGRPINYANRHTSHAIRSLLEHPYQPLDWQLDFKSGWRWRERTWHKQIRFSHAPGVDIKVPWELARMQHLPLLASFFQNLPASSPERPTLQREFRNQVLDFISANPPRFGVNWACAMDVGIRLVNWLTAYCLFRSGGALFDKPFEDILARSVYEHGRHILDNLEWHETLRGNHYLADIVGLLFAAAFLADSPETDAWLAFSIQELVSEVGGQFHPDGTNIEHSTAYHRLSAELVVFATALAVGLPPPRLHAALENYDPSLIPGRPGLAPPPLPLHETDARDTTGQPIPTPFPAWYFERIERMAEFLMDIEKPDGEIPQIGDNDSGRLLKLSPVYRHMTTREAKSRFVSLEGYTELDDDASYWIEDHLAIRHLPAAVAGLINRPDIAAWLAQTSGTDAEPPAKQPDTCLVRILANGVHIPSQRQPRDHGWEAIRTPNHAQKTDATPSQGVGLRTTVFRAAPGTDLRAGLKRKAYPDFGLYLYRSTSLYLAVRCRTGAGEPLTGHMHLDQLAIELVLNGNTLVRDPGTYLYTPFPEERNHYRSVRAHASPWPYPDEPGCLNAGLFHVLDPLTATVLKFEPYEFVGSIGDSRGDLTRQIIIGENSVVITDTGPTDAAADLPAPGIGGPLFSPGYGILENPPP